MKRLFTVAALAALATVPAAACDPEEMDRAMTEVCAAGLSAAAEALDAATPHARDGEMTPLTARLHDLRQHCITGDPMRAAADIVRLARAAARIEARGDRPANASF